MASNLRVDNIQPSTGMGIGIGTANGSVTFNADITGGLNVTTGSVGIGTDITPGDLSITQQNPNIRFDDSDTTNNAEITLDNTQLRLEVDEDNSTASSQIRFRVDGTNKAILDSNGNFKIENGNLVFSTSGTGIDFSATSDGSGTVTAETLSEYEEGSWTPVLASLTGGTQPVVTTSVANGLYTRIGRMVYIEFLMVVTAVTTQGTGNIGVTGLPFTTSGNAYGSNIGITYNDIWDTAFREMYVTGSTLQMIPLGVTQSNATYGGPSNSQGNLSTGYFSAAGWYMRS